MANLGIYRNIGGQATPGYAGLSAVSKALDAGMSVSDIRSSRFQLGDAAKRYLDSYQKVEEQKQNMQTQFQNQLSQINRQQQAFQRQMAQQQQLAAQQLAEQQRQAQEAQRQLMINMQRGDRAPAAVKTASSGAEKTGLTRRGTTGYFGRSGMRIGTLNVPSTGLAITPNMQMPVSGSFA